jgi:hypothetical protein
MLNIIFCGEFSPLGDWKKGVNSTKRIFWEKIM